MSDTVHGHQIMRQSPAPGGGGTRHGRVILVDKGADNGSPSRWVTAWQGRDLMPGAGWDREWGWGHYFSDKKEAEDDFEMRAKRGY